MRNVIFVATGRSGLGHLRRLGNIAQALRALGWTHRRVLVTNAAPAGFDAVERLPFEEVRVAPRDDMAGSLDDADTVVIDTARIPGIENIDRPKCLVLRETRADRLDHFTVAGGWDLMLIPNPADVWRPGNTPRARRVVHCGYIYRRATPAPRGVDRGALQLLVASGGGGSGDKWNEYRSDVAGFLERLRRRLQAPFEVLQCIGPRAGADALIDGVDRPVMPHGALPQCFAAADMVISTAGYNSVLELAQLDVPVLLSSIPTTYDLQQRRVAHWGPLLGGDLRQAGVVDWAAATLAARRRRSPVPLGPSGAGAAAAAVASLLQGGADARVQAG